ncbi:unnamed protein product [Eruca vesicaria subsp. sativa]|uniref:Knottins-like domain-containing protein n=1 Tax=Eruca vesicaria subsp. sativa TaxID=29727 RepID=A0ABC8INK8_ERUVS|nr:unnamed protein product [Eruca vesicaria subsp. sativa]
MAKFASIIILLFVALVFFAAFDTAAPTVKEGQQPKFCKKQSKDWSGLCLKSSSCKKQCIRENAVHGSCNYIFPAHKCICYYPC